MDNNISNGQFFEDWFAKNLPNDFKIIRTPPKFSTTFDEKNLMPDFIIQNKTSKNMYWIECKYRSYIKRYRDSGLLCDDFCINQLDRYEKIEANVYYLIGIHSNQNLKELYLMHLHDMESVLNFNKSQKFKTKSLKEISKELF